MWKSIKLLLCLLLPPWAAIAQENCFCLRDAAENVIIDCKKVRQGVAGEQTLCYDKNKDYRVPVSAAGWTEIPAGQPGCQPCVTPVARSSEVIRGEEEKKHGSAGK